MKKSQDDLITEAVERHAKAIRNRIQARHTLHKAQDNERKTREELMAARDDLQQLEHELLESAEIDNLIPSTLKKEKTNENNG